MAWNNASHPVYFIKIAKNTNDFPELLRSFILGSEEINQRGVPGPPCQSKQERASGGHPRRLQRLHHLAHWYQPQTNPGLVSMGRCAHWSVSPVRFVRCREDDHQLRAGGVPGDPRHPLLLSGWRQRPSRPEQEPGLLL